MKDKRTSSDLRRQHNAELIRRMRNGEALSAFDSKASWFPPRPVIKKDEREMRRLYDDSQRPHGDGAVGDAPVAQADGGLGEAS